jgi:hypothetical protein
MSPRHRSDDWIDEDEYPDDRDVDDLGDDSPRDYNPLTIGYLEKYRPRFWTRGRIIIAAIALLVLAALLLPQLLALRR